MEQIKLGFSPGGNVDFLKDLFERSLHGKWSLVQWIGSRQNLLVNSPMCFMGLYLNSRMEKRSEWIVFLAYIDVRCRITVHS